MFSGWIFASIFLFSKKIVDAKFRVSKECISVNPVQNYRFWPETINAVSNGLIHFYESNREARKLWLMRWHICAFCSIYILLSISSKIGISGWFVNLRHFGQLHFIDFLPKTIFRDLCLLKNHVESESHILRSWIAILMKIGGNPDTFQKRQIHDSQWNMGSLCPPKK